MKKFLSLFVALAMVLSLFAGFAPSAKAVTPPAALTVTGVEGGIGLGVNTTVTMTVAGLHAMYPAAYFTVERVSDHLAFGTMDPWVVPAALPVGPANRVTVLADQTVSGQVVITGNAIGNYVLRVRFYNDVDTLMFTQDVVVNVRDVVYVTTVAGTQTLTSVTFNGLNGDYAGTNQSFWYGPATAGPFTSAADPSSQLPAGWTGAGLLAGVAAHAPFSLTLTVPNNTTRYYVAWSLVGGIWYPGSVMSVTSGTPAAGTYSCPAVDTTGNYLTDSTKRVKLNYYNPVPGNALVGKAPTMNFAGTPTFDLTCQYVYKMGDVIHGSVLLADLATGTPYYIQLRTVDGYVVDTVSGFHVSGTTRYPFQIGTANVSFDGPYDVYSTDTYTAQGAIAKDGTLVSRVFIQYNITWKTKTILNCSGFNTIEGWITRGNGQTVLVPVTVGIAYPDIDAVDDSNLLAAKYDVAPSSSGQFSLTFPINPASNIGYFRVFVRDGYADGTTVLTAAPYTAAPKSVALTVPDNDAMIYEKLSNLPASLSITAATYGSPILLYKNQAAQPVVISLMDQDGNPVTGATWTLSQLLTGMVRPTDYTYSEIAPGYYRFMLNLGNYPDVRFTATKTLFGTSTDSNTIVVALRDLGAFNPYLDINSNDYTFDTLTGRNVCDKLPCTVGNSLYLTVGYWPIPTSMVGNWYIDADSVEVTVNGPVRDLSADGAGKHWIIEKAGKITASISMNVWERKDTTCAWPAGGVDLTNACCHTYTKSFDVCEVLSCTTVSVAVDGASITDASNITVGKSADLVLNISGANAPAGLFCGCNTKIVRVYMVDAKGNIVEDAFTAKTWGGVNKDLSELWYNGIPDSVGKMSAGRQEPCGVTFQKGSDVTDGVNVIDNCEKLTFKDITFNAVTDTDCDNHLVVEVFGLYRTFNACGQMTVSYPFISETIDDININPVVTTLSATPTVYEMGIDPTDILAGVPATINITDPKFSTATGVQGINWSATLGGTKLSKLGITMTPSPLDTGIKFTFSCAFPKAGDLIITGYQYNADCTVKEVVTITLKVVMPTFDVKLGLLDGSTIANDHTITEGFGELIYVTATDPRADGHHDFSTDPNWTLAVSAVKNACGLPTSLVCGTVPSGCTTPSPILVGGYDNPHIDDAPQFKLYFKTYGCASLLVDTFTIASSSVSVNPTEVAFTIPASATHVVFSVKDAHAHGAPNVDVSIVGTTNGVGASGYSFTAGAAKTDKNGEADWAFVPPYSGVYKISAGFTTICTLPCSWSGLTASAKITASYKAPEIDTTAPVVTLTAGIDGSKVASSMLNLTGKVTDNVGVTQLFVGFNKVDVLPDGSFMVPLKLVEGENTITVVAYDAAGNKGTATAKVTYTAPVDTKIVLVLTVGADIVSVNGKATSIDAAPEIVASRTFVPMRFIAEAFGATVDWLPETQGITITLGDHTIGLQIGNATAVIDGNIVSLPAAPYIKNGRTMVPLRVISEAFGGDVVWDPAARTITITYQP